MAHHSTVFAQFLRLMPRHEFDVLARAHHIGAALRRMTRFSQFIALATAHLGRRHSLRDVVANLAAQAPRLYHLGARPVTRLSLARVNEEQPWTLYEALFGRLYARGIGITELPELPGITVRNYRNCRNSELR